MKRLTMKYAPYVTPRNKICEPNPKCIVTSNIKEDIRNTGRLIFQSILLNSARATTTQRLNSPMLEKKFSNGIISIMVSVNSSVFI
jgi:hypothetical protein